MVDSDTSREQSVGDRFTLQFLPILLVMGFILSTGVKIGLSPSLAITLSFFLFFIWMFSMKRNKLTPSDLRFFLIPSFIVITGYFAPYWQFLQYSDQMAHLQISNQLIGRWDWEPWHYGLDFAYRPSIVPGLAGIELALTGKQSEVLFTPFLLLTGCCWAIQHLSERWTNKKLGWISCLVFLLTPGVIIHGRTILIDPSASGMIILSIICFLSLEDKPSKLSMFYFGIITAVVGVAKYSFLFLGPWIIIVLYLSNKTENLRYYIYANLVIYLPFFIINLFSQNDVLAPLEPQINGTVNSMSGTVGDYTFSSFIEDFVDQFGSLLLVLVIIGAFHLYSKNRYELKMSWAILAPLILLHSLILDFGWARYHMPWIALCSAIIPCSLMTVIPSAKTQTKLPKLALFAVVCLIISSSISVSNLVDNKEYVEQKRDYQLSIDDMYGVLSAEIPEDSVVLAVNEIQFGLISGIQTFKFGNAADPIFDSIQVVDADYIITHEVGNRTQFERNWTYLLGSPIDPLSFVPIGERIGVMLWTQNQSRMEDHIWWRNNSWGTEGDVSFFSDKAILEPHSIVSPPNGSSISNILSIQTNANLRDVVLSDLQGVDSVEELCDTIASCMSIDRNLHLNERWVVTGERS